MSGPFYPREEYKMREDVTDSEFEWWVRGWVCGGLSVGFICGMIALVVWVS